MPEYYTRELELSIKVFCRITFIRITVVNSIAKIFEKVVSVRLTGYLNHFNILTDSQFGFRPQHATSHAMIKLYDTALASSIRISSSKQNAKK